MLLAFLALLAAPDVHRLAVLELRSKVKGVDRDQIDASYFTDQVRAGALKAAPWLEVITRENLTVLLQASGKRLEECEGECEVETGRRIGADYVISGELLRVGTRLKLNLRLHETAAARLLSGATAAGATVDELDAAVPAAIVELATPLARGPPAPAATPPQPGVPPQIAAMEAACGRAAGSCFELAVAYVEGKLVPKDDERAAVLYEKACDAGIGMACNNLGYHHATGSLKASDAKRVASLYRKACDLREGLGCDNYGRLIYDGKLVARDDVVAHGYFVRGCELGNAAACNVVGYDLVGGRGCPADREKGKTFYRKACDLGFDLGCSNLRGLSN